jgi:hypothetical protein
MSLQVGSLNRKTALFLVGAVLTILLRLGVFSSSRTETTTVAALESPAMAEKRLALLRVKAAQVPGREAVLKKALSELQSSEKGIIDAPTAAQAQAQLLEIIHRVAEANGFDAKGLDSIPQPKPLGSDYGEVSVTETFTCAIDQLVNFLAALANEPQIIATNEIQITGGNDKKKNIQVRLSLSGVVPKKLVPEKKGVAAF